MYLNYFTKAKLVLFLVQLHLLLQNAIAFRNFFVIPKLFMRLQKTEIDSFSCNSSFIYIVPKFFIGVLLE